MRHESAPGREYMAYLRGVLRAKCMRLVRCSDPSPTSAATAHMPIHYANAYASIE